MPPEVEAHPTFLLASLMSSVFLLVSCGGGTASSGNAEHVASVPGSAPAAEPDPVAPAPGPAPAPEPAPVPSPPPPPIGAATLSWTGPIGTVSGYRVYYGAASGIYDQAFGGGTYVTKTTFTVSGLISGHTYYFVVTAIDAAGGESGYSNEAFKLIP